MSLNILVVPDKFKGTLTAAEAAESIAAGWREARPGDRIELLPMSDGGDGFGDVLSRILEVEHQTTVTVDAANRPRNSQWEWEPNSKTAIIESAQVIGLALLKEGECHPFDLDTRGLGPLIEEATGLGATRCIIGIGGSATNDGGFGVARSLGWTFLDSHANPIQRWTDLQELQSVLAPDRLRKPDDVVVAVDVQNPLLGSNGASRIYGPQKGLRAQDMAHAEACLARLAELAIRTFPKISESVPGDGAAGGLGFGLRCFLGARLESGFELFARHSKLEYRIQKADLVLTGEGSIDASTEMGKGVGEIAKLCRKHAVPCIGLGGIVSLPRCETGTESCFTKTHGITPDLTDSNEAKRNPNAWLRRLAHRTAFEWQSAGSV